MDTRAFKYKIELLFFKYLTHKCEVIIGTTSSIKETCSVQVHFRVVLVITHNISIIILYSFNV